MPTSAEQITSLIADYTELKDFFEGERDRLETARNDLPGLIYEQVYVDEVNGLPGNDGSFEEPYLTLEDALSHFKSGQSGQILLLSNVTWNFRIFGFRSRISVQGRSADNSTSQRRTITFSDTDAADVSRAPGIGVRMGAIQFEEINMVLGSGTIDDAYFLTGGEMWLSFISSDIDGSGGSTFLCDRTGGAAGIGIGATSFSNMGGRWLRGFGAGAAIGPDVSGVLVSPNVDNT